MKNKGLIITLIVIMSLLTIMVSVFTYKAIKNDFSINISFGKIFDNAYKELIVDEEFDNVFTNYGFDINASDVEIKKSINGKVNLKIYGDKEYTSFGNTEESLTIIMSEKSCKGLCIFNKISKVELYVPEDVEGNFIIGSKYGDIDINNFPNSIFTVTSDAGDIDIVGAKEVKIDSKYGDVNIMNSSIINTKTAAGDVKIGSVDDLTVESTTGDIKIESVNGKLNIKSDMGDIKINNANLTENSKIENNTGDVKIGGTNDIYVDASTKIGDVKVNIKDRKAEIVLSIINKIGDIKVNY